MTDIVAEFFEDNFDLLMAESGHRLSDDAKAAALDQVRLYWSKLRDLAEKITETEVQLILPNQRTPAGRPFSIKGVVDIVKVGSETCMYDIKTHDSAFIRTHKDKYEEQLNVYAHIWQELRNQPLDKTAIISTAPDKILKRSLRENRHIDWEDASCWPEKLKNQIAAWDPIINIQFNTKNVATTIESFGKIVDAIEDGSFSPQSLSVLNTPIAEGRALVFGTEVCGNCDVRYSCQSYREFSVGRRKDGVVSEFVIGDVRPGEDEIDEWLDQDSESNEISLAVVTEKERQEADDLDVWMDLATKE